jgi:hypothetical protein
MLCAFFFSRASICISCPRFTYKKGKLTKEKYLWISRIGYGNTHMFVSFSTSMLSIDLGVKIAKLSSTSFL